MNQLFLLLFAPLSILCLDPATIFKKNDVAMQGSKNVYIESEVSNSLQKTNFVEKTWKKSEAGTNYFKQESLYPNGTSKLNGFDGKQYWEFLCNTIILGEKEQIFNVLFFNDQEYKNLKSKRFTVKSLGDATVDKEDCYVLEIGNTILPDVKIRQFYSTKTFFLLREEYYSKNVLLNVTDYANYNAIGNFAPIAFKKTVRSNTSGNWQIEQVVTVKKYKPLEASVSFALPEPKQYAKILGSQKSVTVPFLLSNKHVYLPVKIGNTVKLWLVDTGYSLIQITSVYAKELGLKSSFAQALSALLSKVSALAVKLPAIQILNHKTNEPVVSTEPIDILQQNMSSFNSEVAGFPEKEFGGILGIEFISQFVMAVDYAKSEITFFDKESFDYKGSGYKLSGKIEDALTIPIKIDYNQKSIEAKFIVDLGSDSNPLATEFSKSHGLDKLEGIITSITGEGGSAELLYHPFNLIVGKSLNLQNVMFGITKSQKLGGSLEKSPIDGNLGYPFLKNFKIYFDYKNNHVILEKGADFNKQSFKQATGMYFGPQDIAEFVQSNSVAEKAGFKKGDRVISINGTVLADLNQESAVKFVKTLDDYQGKDFVFEYVPYQLETKTLSFK